MAFQDGDHFTGSLRVYIQQLLLHLAITMATLPSGDYTVLTGSLASEALEAEVANDCTKSYDSAETETI